MNTSVFQSQSQRLFTFYVVASLVLLSLMPVLPSLIPLSHAATNATLASGSAAEISAGTATTNQLLGTITVADITSDVPVYRNGSSTPTAGSSALTDIPATLKFADHDNDDAYDDTPETIVNDADADGNVDTGEVVTNGTATLTAFPATDIFADAVNVGDNLFDGTEDVLRRIHNGSVAYVDGQSARTPSTDTANNQVMFADNGTGDGVYADGELLVEDNDDDGFISSGDAVVEAGSANSRELDNDGVCFDDDNADSDYDTGESIWLDVAGDCASFTTGADIILVADTPNATGVEFTNAGEQEVFFVDDNNDGLYTCTRTGTCEALVWTDGTDFITDGTAVAVTAVFFDSSTAATDGIATTGMGWDEVTGTTDLNDFPTTILYIESVADSKFTINEDLYQLIHNGSAASTGETRAFAGTDLFSDSNHGGTYTDGELIVGSADSTLGTGDTITVSGTADLVIFSGLASNVSYFDSNADSSYTDGEDIIRDVDNSGYYNADIFSTIIINNISVGDNKMNIADFTNIELHRESGATTGYQSGEDTTILETYNSADSVTFGSALTVNDTASPYPSATKIHVVGNFATGAAAGETFMLGIPLNGIVTAAGTTHAALTTTNEFEVYGAMTSTSVTATNLRVGVTSTYTLNFTTIASVLADDTINFTFPSGYNVAGATSGTCSTMDGSFATSVASQVVTLTRSTGTTEIAGAQTCTVGGIINPTTVGSSGTFTFATEQATTTLALDRNTAVTAVNISAAAGSSSSSSSSASAPTTLALTSPNGGGTYAGNSTTTIAWTAGGSSIAKVNLSYSTDGGNTYTTIVSNLDVAGSYTWTVPNVATTTGKVKVVGVTSSGSVTTYEDISDSNFTITSASATTTTTPTPTTTTPTVTVPTGTVMPIAQVSKGSLVQGSGSAVYYYATDGKRYVFPNEAVYLSWYPDFSGVVKISEADMATVQMSKRVTVRPGTWMIKIQSDPKVYAVEPNGVKRHVADETTAKALFGMDWNKRIIDVEPTMFPDYTTGTQLTSVSHPDGALMSVSGKNYLYSGGQHREVTSAGFTANRFQNKFVLTPGSAVSLNLGSALTTAENAISMFK